MPDSPLEYKPNIGYKKPTVKGDVRVIDPSDPQTAQKGREDEEYQQVEELLDSAIAIDEKYQTLRDEIEKQLSNLTIPVDPDAYPQLSEAIFNVSEGKTNNVIDYSTLKRSMKILYNSFLAQFGFEPTQLLFAEPSEHGPLIPEISFPKTLNCNDVANLSIADLQKGGEKQSMLSVLDRRSRDNQFSLLKQLWHMLLAFVLRWSAGLLRKTKLDKAPVVGSTVKNIINRLEQAADRIEDWIRRGGGYSFETSFKSQNPDIADIIGNAALSPDNGASKCIQSAFQIVKYAINWATHSQLYGKDSPSDVNPQALLLWPYLEYQQNIHEATKLNIKLLSDPDIFKDKKETLTKNTQKIRYFANRYLNRSIIDIRK